MTCRVPRRTESECVLAVNCCTDLFIRTSTRLGSHTNATESKAAQCQGADKAGERIFQNTKDILTIQEGED